MGAAREGADLLWYIFGWASWARGWRKFRIVWAFERKIWQSEYVWHDTIGVRWNKLLGCRIKGHKDVHTIVDDEGRDETYDYCFACARKVNERIA